ncbi:MAG: hypothetical protein ACI8PP_002263 [Candidatus Pseudothioglobus sp.]|jgi:hypothetical protein
MKYATHCTQRFTQPFLRPLAIGQHHIALLFWLLTPAAAFPETTQTTRVVGTGTHIEQHTTHSAADYDHCHFDDAHGHLHCYTERLGHQCDEVIKQRSNTIVRTTRRYSEPTTIIERHYRTNVVTQPNVILTYGDTHRYRPNPYYGLGPGIFLRYNDFRYSNHRYNHRYNNRYNNNQRYNRQRRNSRSNSGHGNRNNR